MRKLGGICLALWFSSLSGQVGIKTANPLSTLDVAGDIILRNELSIGGTDLTNGNPGLANQILVSQGDGKPPTWKFAKVPFMENSQYKLINSYVFDDAVGITALSKGVAGDGVFLNKINDGINDNWKKITGLSQPVEVVSDKNKITYQFQTGVELVSTVATGSARFICGIFKNDSLVAMRPDRLTVYAANTPVQYIYTLNYTETDSEIGKHTISVACRKIETSDNDNYFSIGTKVPAYGNNGGTNNRMSNAFALKSFFKIDVAEHVTYTN